MKFCKLTVKDIPVVDSTAYPAPVDRYRALEMLSPDDVKVIIHQMVSFVNGEEVVKMSKRNAKTYTLDDLIDEVGDIIRTLYH